MKKPYYPHPSPQQQQQHSTPKRYYNYNNNNNNNQQTTTPPNNHHSQLQTYSPSYSKYPSTQQQQQQRHQRTPRGRSLDPQPSSKRFQERYRREPDFDSNRPYSPERYYQQDVREREPYHNRRETNVDRNTLDAGRDRSTNATGNHYDNRVFKSFDQSYHRPQNDQRDLPLSGHARTETNLSAVSPRSRSSPGNRTDSNLDNDRYRQRRESQTLRGGKPYNSYGHHHHNSSYSGRGNWRGNYNGSYAGKTRGSWKPHNKYQSRYKTGQYTGQIGSVRSSSASPVQRRFEKHSFDDARSERSSVSSGERRVRPEISGIDAIPERREFGLVIKPDGEAVVRETEPSSGQQYQVPLVEHAVVEDAHHLTAARLRKALAERRVSVSQLKDDLNATAGLLTVDAALKHGSMVDALAPPPRSLEPGEITEGDEEELKAANNGVRAASRGNNITKSMTPRIGEAHSDARGRASIVLPTSPIMKVETGEVVLSGPSVPLNTGRNTSGSPVDSWVQDVKRSKTRVNRADSVVQDTQGRAQTQNEPGLMNSEANDFLRQYTDRYLRDRYDNSSNSRDQMDMDIEVNETFQTPSRRSSFVGDGERERKQLPSYSEPVSRASNGFRVPEIPQKSSHDQASRYGGQTVRPSSRDRRPEAPTWTPAPYLPAEMSTRNENERSKSTAPAYRERGRDRVPIDKEVDKRRRNSYVEQETGFVYDQPDDMLSQSRSHSRVQEVHRGPSTPMKEPASDLYTRRAASVHASYERTNYSETSARRATTPSRATGFERVPTTQEGNFPMQDRKRIQTDVMARNHRDREKSVTRANFESGMRISQQPSDYERTGFTREQSRPRNPARESPPGRAIPATEYSIDRRQRKEIAPTSEKVYQRSSASNHQRLQSTEEFERWNERGQGEGERLRGTNDRDVCATERDNRTFSVPPMSERSRAQEQFVFPNERQSTRGRTVHRENRQPFYERRETSGEVHLKHRQTANPETVESNGDQRDRIVEVRDESMSRDQSVEMDATSVRDKYKKRRSKREFDSRSSSKAQESDHRHSSRLSRHESRIRTTSEHKSRNKRERSESESPDEATSRREARRKIDHRQTFSISLPVINSLIATGMLKVLLPRDPSGTAKLCFASEMSSAEAKAIETLEFNIEGPKPVEQKSEERVEGDRGQQQGQKKPDVEMVPAATKPMEDTREESVPESRAGPPHKLLKSFADAGYLAREDQPRPISDRPVEFGWPMVDYVDGLVSRLREKVLTPDPENSNRINSSGSSNTNTGSSSNAKIVPNDGSNSVATPTKQSESELRASITATPSISKTAKSNTSQIGATSSKNIPVDNETGPSTAKENDETEHSADFGTPPAANGSTTLTPPYKLANGARPLMERMVYDQDNVSVEELRAKYPRYIK